MADCTCIRVTMDICRHCGGTTPMARLEARIEAVRLEEDRDAARHALRLSEEWGRGMAESRLNYMTMWGNVRVERDAALMQVSSTARALGQMEARAEAAESLVRRIADDPDYHHGDCLYTCADTYACTCDLGQYMTQEVSPDVD